MHSNDTELGKSKSSGRSCKNLDMCTHVYACMTKQCLQAGTTAGNCVANEAVWLRVV